MQGEAKQGSLLEAHGSRSSPNASFYGSAFAWDVATTTTANTSQLYCLGSSEAGPFQARWSVWAVGWYREEGSHGKPSIRSRSGARRSAAGWKGHFSTCLQNRADAANTPSPASLPLTNRSLRASKSLDLHPGHEHDAEGRESTNKWFVKAG